MPPRRYIHIVWSPATGPIHAYTNSELAFAHGRVMLGVDVTSLPISDSLPENVQDDIESENYEEEETPVEAPNPDAVVVDVDQLDDKEK